MTGGRAAFLLKRLRLCSVAMNSVPQITIEKWRFGQALRCLTLILFFVQLFGILLLLVVIGITKHTEGASLKEVLSQSVYDLNYLQKSHILRQHLSWRKIPSLVTTTTGTSTRDTLVSSHTVWGEALARQIRSSWSCQVWPGPTLLWYSRQQRSSARLQDLAYSAENIQRVQIVKFFLLSFRPTSL